MVGERIQQLLYKNYNYNVSIIKRFLLFLAFSFVSLRLCLDESIHVTPTDTITLKEELS